jgi:hypothetical protein
MDILSAKLMSLGNVAALYPCNEASGSFLDVSGNARHAATKVGTGGEITGTGPRGKARSFADGGSHYYYNGNVVAPGSAMPDNFSICLLMQCVEATNGRIPVGLSVTSSNNSRIDVRPNGNANGVGLEAAAVSDAGTTRSIVYAASPGAPLLSMNDWMFAVLTYANPNLILYFNGIAIGKNTSGIGTVTPTYTGIGSLRIAAGNFAVYNNLFSHVAFFTATLTPAQVYDLAKLALAPALNLSTPVIGGHVARRYANG